MFHLFSVLLSLKSSCEALAVYLPSTLNRSVANITAAAKLCSQTLCQGNGRCVRQNPDTADYLYLNSDNFTIQQRDGKYMAVGVPSQTDLNVFANKFTCQCYVGQMCSANTSISVPRTPLIIQVWFYFICYVWSESNRQSGILKKNTKCLI